jgi:hypothetical protein
MKYTTGRQKEEAVEIKRIIIYIGEDTYRLNESVDGRLTVNKTSDGMQENISVHPRYANEIDIS